MRLILKKPISGAEKFGKSSLNFAPPIPPKGGLILCPLEKILNNLKTDPPLRGQWGEKLEYRDDFEGNSKHDQYHMANPKFVRISIFKS